MLQLIDFDIDYFYSLEGEDAWIAIGDEEYQKDYSDQQYFTVVDDKNEKYGIIGIFDFMDQKNLTHIVIDPSKRGKGYLRKIYDLLMEEVDVEFLFASVDIANIFSQNAHENAGCVRISDTDVEKKSQKRIYKYSR